MFISFEYQCSRCLGSICEARGLKCVFVCVFVFVFVCGFVCVCMKGRRCSQMHINVSAYWDAKLHVSIMTVSLVCVCNCLL